MRTLKIGELVAIKTVDGGKLGSANNLKRKPQVRAWEGRVIGPSVLGDELWLIKAKNGTTYTVPRREIT